MSLRTDVAYNGSTLPFIVAKQQGYFEAEGLDVTINPGKGSATTLQTVANGSDDIGYADAGVLIQLAAKGASVLMIADVVQETPLEVLSLSSSGIRTPSDLMGKTGGFVDGSAAEQLWPAYAKAAKVDPEGVTFVHVDVPTRNNLLLAGKTAFSFGLYNVTEPELTAKCNCEITAFRYSDAGVEPLSSGIVTSPAFAKAHPDILKKFLAAFVKAAEWAQQNPAEATEAFMAGAGKTTLKPDVVKEQWTRTATLLHSANTQGQGIGCMSTKDWENSVSLLGQYANVDTTKVDLAKIWTNDYLTGCSS